MSSQAIPSVSSKSFYSPVPCARSLVPILVSRFLLNLRHAKRDDSQTIPLPVTTVIGSFTTPSTLLGNIGESLDHSVYDEDYADSDENLIPRVCKADNESGED